MRSSQSRPNSQSGFTLIELMVVMLILGILAAIVIPSFSGDKTKVVQAEVCGVAQTEVLLPEEAGGAYTAEGQQKLILHSSYSFTLDTTEQTIKSIEPLGAEEKVLRC